MLGWNGSLWNNTLNMQPLDGFASNHIYILEWSSQSQDNSIWESLAKLGNWCSHKIFWKLCTLPLHNYVLLCSIKQKQVNRFNNLLLMWQRVKTGIKGIITFARHCQLISIKIWPDSFLCKAEKMFCTLTFLER